VTTRVAIVVGVVGLLGVAAASLGAELEPLPPAPLDALPPEARRQIEEQRREVEEALAGAAGDDALLADAFGELGKLYYLYGLTDIGEIAWTNAATLAPRDIRWQYYLGHLARLEGDLEAARGRLANVLALRPDDVPTLLLLAQIDLDEGRRAAAAERFARVLEIDPVSAAALAGLGRIALAEGRPADAVTLLQRALVGQPEGSSLHHQLGLAYRELGDLEMARQHLARNRGVAVTLRNPLMEQLVPLVRSAHFKARLGIEALQGGDAALAVERLEEAARQDPRSAWIRYNLAVAYEAAGQSGSARAELAAALELDPDYSRAHFNLGSLLARSGDHAAAARHFARASEIDPGDEAARLEQAVALSRLGDREAALAQLEELVSTAPRFFAARLALAELLAQLGREGEALAVVEESLAVDASNTEWAAARELAGRIAERSAPLEAERHYRRALDLDPDAEAPRLRLAMLLGRRRLFAEAAAEFGRLVADHPDDAEYRTGQGMSLLLGERYAAAAAALEAAHARFPGDEAITLLLARLLATCPEPALRDGERALELAGGVAGAPPTLEHAETAAMALAELGRFAEAQTIQRQVVARRAAGPALERSRRYLASYDEGRPVRAPWAGGG
jgi:tetratricopeptide (TPR) repeat protein